MGPVSSYLAGGAGAFRKAGLARGAAHLVALIAGRDARCRIRLVQWFTAGGVYTAAALLMSSGIDGGWMRVGHLVGWCAFVASGLAVAFIALRTGWSERLRDPALTEWQIVMGVVAVCWGYLICGPVRTVALLPLLLIFAFGSFALRERRIAVLAAFASAGLLVVTSMHRYGMAPSGSASANAQVPIDWINLVMSLVLLLALSLVAARLSALRTSLLEKREALRSALQEVQRLATTDELTGLPNRRAMMERSEVLRLEASRGGAAFCVAVLDIDHFKQINDSLGHAQGDAVLWGFADNTQGSLAAPDFVGRWGGEEFLLAMPGVSLEDACVRVNRILRDTRTLVAAGRPLSFSAGVATYGPGDDVSGLVLRADKAMYAAKDAGRNCVRVAD